MTHTDQQRLIVLSRTRFAVNSGFTLIELLVVIAIIAVLASLMLPVVAMVRDSALSIKCLSNSRQLANAALSYANDNKGVLPGDGTGQTYFHWTFSMASYVGAEYVWGAASNNNIKMYQCPLNNPLKQTPSSGWPANYGTAYAMSQFSSILPNAAGKAGYWRDNRMKALVRVGAVKQPSEWVMWGEQRTSYWWWRVLGTTAGDVANGAAFPHRGRMSHNYVDGRVGWVTRQSYDAWKNYTLAGL